MYGLSDHNIIYVILKKECVKKKKISFECRNIKQYSVAALREKHDDQDWSLFDDCSDPNVAWYLMHNYFVCALDKIAPFVTLDRIDEKDPWIPSELLSLVRE